MGEWQADLLDALQGGGESGATALRRFLEHRAMLDRLIIDTMASGVYVRIQARLADWEQSMRGGFVVDDGIPAIELFRKSVAVAEDPVAELVTLAHECGHFYSWREGWRTSDYLAVVDQVHGAAPVEAPAAKLILQEEWRAWRRAKRRLAELGFKEWTAFDAHRKDGLSWYCKRLGASTELLAECEADCEAAPKDTHPPSHCETCEGFAWVRREGAQR